MKFRHRIAGTLIGGILFSTVVACAASKTNIIIIYADDVGYFLPEDPAGRNNLAGACPAKAAELKKLLEAELHATTMD